jgi:SAM-dependent methyltransferase
MKQRQDAFGHALLDTYSYRGGFAAIERDDGYIDLDCPLEKYFTGYDKWSYLERQTIRNARGKVLDIGAGAGRHSLHLQNLGLKVTAIDKSPAAVKLCRLRGIMDARVRSIEELNPEDGTFDTILMLGNNFGLLGSLKKAKRLLKKLAACTSADAQLLTQSLDPYKAKDPLNLSYQRHNRSVGRMSGQIRMRVRYRNYITPWFDYLFVSESELRHVIEGTTWKVDALSHAEESKYFARIVKARTNSSCTQALSRGCQSAL